MLGRRFSELTTLDDVLRSMKSEDNSYPNSVYNNFEVHSDTSTTTLLTSLNDPAFARAG